MRYRMKKIVYITSCTLLLTSLYGCTASDSLNQLQTESPDSSLRILLCGESGSTDTLISALQSQMDEEHFWNIEMTFADAGEYNWTLAESLSSHEDYDLVFDAPWINLYENASKNYYLDLQEYFSNPEYPGLYHYFPEKYMDANRIDGKIYAIPFTNSYYDIPGIYYRQDILKQMDLGFDEIQTREQLLLFWEEVSQNTELQPVSLESRGFFTLNLPEISLRTDGIYDVPGISFWEFPVKVMISPDNQTVLGVIFPGDTPDQLPDNLTENFLDQFFLANARYSQWLDTKDLLKTEKKSDFIQNRSASLESELGTDGSIFFENQLKKYDPEAEVAFWPYDSSFWNLQEEQTKIPTDYKAWNYLCIPSYSQNSSSAIAFLDWLYSDTSLLDTINYGVEGIHWNSINDQEYTLSSEEDSSYSFPAYEIAWNPSYRRLNAQMKENEHQLAIYTTEEQNYTASPLLGFIFDTRNINLELSALKALFSEYYIGFTHGAYGVNTTETIQELHEKSMDAGLEKLRKEIYDQIQTYLDENSLSEQ